MAVICHLEFDGDAAHDALRMHLKPSVKWLLDNRLKSGGWPYDWTNPPHALGFLSTASSICALGLYLDLLKTDDRQLSSQIHAAISRGLDGLVREQKHGTWSGDGSPSDKQIRDSALALRLLLLANRKGQLDGPVPGFHNAVTGLATGLSKCVLDEGWPKAISETAPDLAASISALAVIRDAGNPGNVPPEKMQALASFIVTKWELGEAAPSLTAWDWQCLAILASGTSGTINRPRAAVIENSCETLRAKSRAGKLTSGDLSKIDAKIRDAISFALTEGEGIRPNPIRGRLLRPIIWTSKKVSERLLVQGVIAVLGIILAIVVFGVDPIDYIRKLFSPGFH